MQARDYLIMACLLQVKTYNFFTRELRPDNLETVYKGIQKLMIVDIVPVPVIRS